MHGLWKDKKGTKITNAFQIILKGSNRFESKSKRHKPNKIWVDKGSKFFNRLIKSWLEKVKAVKRKGDKLYVKWKGYDSSNNSWIDKKDIV